MHQQDSDMIRAKELLGLQGNHFAFIHTKFQHILGSSFLKA